MAPVQRGAQRQSSPSRRQASAPTQNRRNAASAPPTRRQAAAAVEEPEATAFDASDEAEDEAEEELDDDELPTVLDLSDTKPATYEVLPKGIYPGYIDEIEYVRSQNSNKLQLVWKIKVEDSDAKEHTLRWYTGLEGDSLPRTLASLAKLDPELDLAHFEPDSMDEHFGGWEVMVRVTIRPDREDRKIKRNNIADVLLPEE